MQRNSFCSQRFAIHYSQPIDEIEELNIPNDDNSDLFYHVKELESLIVEAKQMMSNRHVRPGITGWAQVNGRNAISWKQKFEYDFWYVQNISFLLDLKILLLTFKKFLFVKVSPRMTKRPWRFLRGMGRGEALVFCLSLCESRRVTLSKLPSNF